MEKRKGGRSHVPLSVRLSHTMSHTPPLPYHTCFRRCACSSVHGEAWRSAPVCAMGQLLQDLDGKEKRGVLPFVSEAPGL